LGLIFLPKARERGFSSSIRIIFVKIWKEGRKGSLKTGGDSKKSQKEDVASEGSGKFLQGKLVVRKKDLGQNIVR